MYTTGAGKRFEAVNITASKLFQLSGSGCCPGSWRRKFFQTFLIPLKKTA
jgi:hypothetical protein